MERIDSITQDLRNMTPKEVSQEMEDEMLRLISNEAKHKIVLEAMKSFQPGKVPEDIWIEILRIMGGVSYELTPIRLKEGKFQIYMKPRSSKDPIFANEIAIPGTMFDGDTKSFEQAFRRIKITETDDIKLSEPEFVGFLHRDTKRGMEFAFVHMAFVEGGNDNDFYDIANLPEAEMVEHHIPMIEMVNEYLKSRPQGNKFLQASN